MKATALFLLLCSSLMAYEVKVRVIDDQDRPVAGANVSVFFVKQGKSDKMIGVSGSDGLYFAYGQSTLGVDIIIECLGHYPSRVENLDNKMDHDVVVVLPRVLNPTSLFALTAFHPKIPSPSQWYGFDFETADWVAPHGKGKTVDVLFRYMTEFQGWRDELVDPKERERIMALNRARDSRLKEEWSFEKFKAEHGKWGGVLEIAFPGKEEGLAERKFTQYSEMKMLHYAPSDGYVTTWRYTTNTYFYPGSRRNVGFFLRTRVRLDKDGGVVSANYAKVYGDFAFNPATGKMSFSYYFNPVSNDRNLEFDPKRNLFPKAKQGANVRDP
jgi:hypothetical protein